AGRDRVGVRVPDHDRALALLSAVAPLTATSANVSGRPSARTVDELDDEIREAAAVVLDGGQTPGGGSTVVDVAAGEIHRRGALADDIEAWLSG
ncbi:MAG: L-threonylcarbamoyladenylate synthase, partial [Haloarculaceae archaeon]